MNGHPSQVELDLESRRLRDAVQYARGNERRARRYMIDVFCSDTRATAFRVQFSSLAPFALSSKPGATDDAALG